MIIYKWTNKTNGKVYIGQTTTPLEARVRSHKYEAITKQRRTKFYNAIRKYGVDGFDIEVVDTAPTVDELDQREIYWIAHYNAITTGYNQRTGGSKGSRLDEEAKGKISASLTEYFSDPAVRHKLSKDRKGRKQSAETIAKNENHRKA